MNWRFRLVALIGCAAVAGAEAGNSRRDLSAGAAYPSNNSAVVENPAALATTVEPMVDVTLFLDSDYKPEGGYGAYARVLGPTGAGLLITQQQGTVGFGFGGGHSAQIGMGLQYAYGDGSAEDSRFGLTAGIRLFPADGAVVGIVTDDLQTLSDVTLGFGKIFGNITVEADFELSGSHVWDPSTASLLPTVVYKHDKQFSVKLGYNFGLIPTASFEFSNFKAAVVVRIVQGIQFYAGMGDTLGGTYSMGVRLGQ